MKTQPTFTLRLTDWIPIKEAPLSLITTLRLEKVPHPFLQEAANRARNRKNKKDACGWGDFGAHAWLRWLSPQRKAYYFSNQQAFYRNESFKLSEYWVLGLPMTRGTPMYFVGNKAWEMPKDLKILALKDCLLLPKRTLLFLRLKC